MEGISNKKSKVRHRAIVVIRDKKSRNKSRKSDKTIRSKYKRSDKLDTSTEEIRKKQRNGRE